MITVRYNNNDIQFNSPQFVMEQLPVGLGQTFDVVGFPFLILDFITALADTHTVTAAIISITFSVMDTVRSCDIVKYHEYNSLRILNQHPDEP